MFDDWTLLMLFEAAWWCSMQFDVGWMLDGAWSCVVQFDDEKRCCMAAGDSWWWLIMLDSMMFNSFWQSLVTFEVPWCMTMLSMLNVWFYLMTICFHQRFTEQSIMVSICINASPKIHQLLWSFDLEPLELLEHKRLIFCCFGHVLRRVDCRTCTTNRKHTGNTPCRHTNQKHQKLRRHCWCDSFMCSTLLVMTQWQGQTTLSSSWNAAIGALCKTATSQHLLKRKTAFANDLLSATCLIRNSVSV